MLTPLSARAIRAIRYDHGFDPTATVFPLYMRLIERATPLVEKIPFLVMSSERKFKPAARSAVARQEAFTPSLWSATISVHAFSVEARLFFCVD